MVSSGNRPLPETMMIHTYVATWRYCACHIPNACGSHVIYELEFTMRRHAMEALPLHDWPIVTGINRSPVYLIINVEITIGESINIWWTCKCLWHSDALWQIRSGLTLTQVMICFLMAPSRYLDQCWLIFCKVHSTEAILQEIAERAIVKTGLKI